MKTKEMNSQLCIEIIAECIIKHKQACNELICKSALDGIITKAFEAVNIKENKVYRLVIYHNLVKKYSL